MKRKSTLTDMLNVPLFFSVGDQILPSLTITLDNKLAIRSDEGASDSLLPYVSEVIECDLSLYSGMQAISIKYLNYLIETYSSNPIHSDRRIRQAYPKGYIEKASILCNSTSKKVDGKDVIKAIELFDTYESQGREDLQTKIEASLASFGIFKTPNDLEFCETYFEMTPDTNKLESGTSGWFSNKKVWRKAVVADTTLLS